MTTDRVTILHVSDFHFTSKKARDQKIVVDALLEDVKAQCVGNKTPDIILFCGDLTNSPPVDEHAAAYDFLLAPLLKATNTTNERLFIVPGNHDVQRDGIDAFKVEHEEWQSNANNLDVINDAFDKRKFEPAFAAKFERYLALEADITERPPVFQNLFCRVHYIEALQTNIVVLNSSMLSTGGHKDFGPDEGKMVIPEFAVEEALRHLEANSFKLFTTHHPLGAFSENGNSYLSRILEKNADIHLFGHMHDPKARQITGFEGRLLSNQAGAVFTHRKEWYIGYAIISVDLQSGHSRTCLRSYYPRRNSFDRAVDRVPEGEFYSSNESRIFWQGMGPPFNDFDFRSHLTGSATASLKREWTDTGIIEPGGSQAFVAPRLNVIDQASVKEERAQIDVPVTFEELVKRDDNFVIYSPQEYGRTTLLREFQLQLLATAASAETPRSAIMINFSDIGYNPSQLLRTVKARSMTDPALFDVEALLKNGSICLLVDDVVFSQEREMSVLRQFVANYPKVRYVFSALTSTASRYGVQVALKTPVSFSFVELCELRRKEMRELVKWKLGESDDVERVLDRLHTEINEINLPFTAANGTILMTIYEQNNNFRPINRSVVIEQFVDATLRKGAMEQSRRETFDYSNKTALLAYLAGWMAQRDCYDPAYETLRMEMKNYIDDFGLETDLDKLLVEFFNARILMKRPDETVTFRYRATLEYFIALHMINDARFKDWVLHPERYLTYINEVQYYAGKVRNDANLVNLMGERFQEIINEVETIAGGKIDLNQIATISVPRKGNSQSLGHLQEHLLGEPLSRDERDQVLEGNLPANAGDRQGVYRPRIEHPGHKLMISLSLYSGLVKNMELIASSEKMRHLRSIWYGWSIFLNLSLSLVGELAKHRKMRINGVDYEITAPRAMPDEELGRIIALNMPTSITRLISATLGTEKLRRQLTEPDLEDQGHALVVDFLRASLVADLRLPETPGALKSLVNKVHVSDYLSEAVVWKVIDLRRMDLISASHFEAVKSEVAGVMARLRGGSPKQIADSKRKQIAKLNQDGLMLRINRQRNDN